MIDLRQFKQKTTNRIMNRRSVLRLTAAGAGVVVASRYFTTAGRGAAPTPGGKGHLHGRLRPDRLANPWRVGESESMRAEAKRLGYTLIETDANRGHRQADRGRGLADRAGGRYPDLPAARIASARAFGRAGQSGRHPGDPDRPRRRSRDRQTGRGLHHLHRLRFRRSGTARRRVAGRRRPAAKPRSSSSKERPGPTRRSTARRASTTTWPGPSRERRPPKARTRAWRSSPRRRETSFVIPVAR